MIFTPPAFSISAVAMCVGAAGLGAGDAHLARLAALAASTNSLSVLYGEFGLTQEHELRLDE